MTEEDILELIKNDRQMMAIIQTAMGLGLPDCWISAGFIRNRIWDHLHDYNIVTPLDDIDVVYFDKNKIDKNIEKGYDLKLQQKISGVNWSVKNLARMHIPNNNEPYVDSTDAISKYTETPTSIAVAIRNGNLILNTPHGIDDLVNLIVRPTPHYMTDKYYIYKNRIKTKNWLAKWPKLKIIMERKEK
jgi:hypothetical protein